MWATTAAGKRKYGSGLRPVQVVEVDTEEAVVGVEPHQADARRFRSVRMSIEEFLVDFERPAS